MLRGVKIKNGKSKNFRNNKIKFTKHKNANIQEFQYS